MDVLRKAEEGRSAPQAAIVRTATFTRDIELEPLADQAGRAGTGEPPDIAPAPHPVAHSAAPARPSPAAAMLTSWLLLGAAGLGAAVAVAGWIWFEARATVQAYAPMTNPPLIPIASNEQAAPPPEDILPEPPPSPRPSPQSPSSDTRHAPIDAPDEEPLQLRPGRPATALASYLLLSAHEAYTAGDLPHAQTQYRQALQNDPANLDALNGMGAIALQQGQPEQAEDLFRRALLLNPHDPVALAGLSQTRAPDLPRAETRLRISLAKQPDAIATQIALGDSLAGQQRWAEAQQAYFQAHALAPEDPDLAYNLAVSLDHLGQRQPAVTYYRKALELAAHHPARFARTQGEVRLHTLLPQEPRP